MSVNLKDKVIIVTGSSIGIGRETAMLFAKEKCKLVITYYKDKKEGQDTAEKCKELGAEVLLLNLDVTKNESIKECVKQVVTKFKHIDILVNNAGVIVWKPLIDQSFSDIEEQVRVNLEGLIKMTRECLPYIKECVINISSGAGKQGFRDLTTYCGTKFGVRGFTQAMADEDKLRFYSVNPGMTATRMTDYKGVSALKVAEIVVNTAKGKYKVENGGDIDVWKVLNESMY